MTRTLSFSLAMGIVAMTGVAAGAGPADGAARFEVIDQSAVALVPGLRALTVRDSARRTCYRIFVNEPASRGDAGSRLQLPDLDQAANTRDRQLADLLHSYELDRGAIPGTIAPNPFRYEWQADSVQMQFALTVLARAFQHLEQRLDQLPDSPGGAVAVLPESCPAAPREPQQ
jgi:hypothetical protein